MAFDPYLVLEISKTATHDDIKKAHRKLAKKYHPDLNPGDKTAEKKFIEITQAYEMLETPEKREKFDRGGFEQAEDFSFNTGASSPYYHETQNGGGRYTYSFKSGEDDLFESLFSRYRSGKGEDISFRGADQLFRLEVEFKDAVLGAEHEITFPGNKKLKVSIPAGIESGKKLRIAGQGSPGSGKGPAGDVYIEIQVKPSMVFKRVGNDLEMELPVSLTESILGGVVEVPTLEKSIKLTIPPGANTGQRLRVKEKGVVNARLKTRGNLIVVLKVVLPAEIDDELKEMIQKWSKNHHYDPRVKPVA